MYVCAKGCVAKQHEHYRACKAGDCYLIDPHFRLESRWGLHMYIAVYD